MTQFDFEVTGRPMAGGNGWKHIGLNPEHLTALRLSQWRKQGKKCALCGSAVTLSAGVSDHDHKTGVARGVLHKHCNSWLGTLEVRGEEAAQRRVTRGCRPSEWMRKARQYLAEWEPVVAELVLVYHQYGALAGTPSQPMPYGFSAKLVRAGRRARVRRACDLRERHALSTARVLRGRYPVGEARAAELALIDVSGTLSNCIIDAYQTAGFVVNRMH